MRERVISLYTEGLLSKAGLKNAVPKKWISAEDYKALTGEDYVE